MTISMRKTATDGSNTANKLGTFGGVFIPGILTIPGIILFLRLGYVAGNAGSGRGSKIRIETRGGGNMKGLSALFEPKTMAVVGVSLSNDSHPANVIYNKNYHRYPVKVFAVNPRGGVLHDEEVYTGISKIPDKVDLAVIAVRSEFAPDIIEECVKSGVKAAVVISGGFSEVGRQDLQDRMVSIAQEAKFPFVGPNCLGIYVPFQVDTFFLPPERMVTPQRGNVAFISQSGGILVDHLIKFTEEGVGLAKAVSIGNKAYIRELDLLNFLAHDPHTDVIVFYIEGFEKNEGRRFAIAAGKCPKPVIVLKSGKSSAGQKVVSSHTASLAGDYASFAAALEQYGVIVAENEMELVSYCESLSAYKSAIKGSVGIVTGSGGHGAMAVDACADNGLSVPDLDRKTQKEIGDNLSTSVKSIASVNNPVDLTGSAIDDDFVQVTRALFNKSDIDCVIALLLPYLPGITQNLGARLSSVSKQMGKPLIAYVPHLDKS